MDRAAKGPAASKRSSYVVEIGRQPDMLDRWLARGTEGVLKVRVPRFSDSCVCCARPAKGQRWSYYAGDGDVSAEPFSIPLCLDCQDHGLIEPRSSGAPFSWMMLAVLVGFLGVSVWSETGEPVIALLFVVPSALMLCLACWRWYRVAQKRRAITSGEHHGEFEISVSSVVTRITTTNEALVADLLANNPDARRLP